MTMSTSSAPSSTTARVSATLISRRRLARRERGRDRRDLDAAPASRSFATRDEVRVDADRRDRRDGGVDGIGPHRLRAERRDLARACPAPSSVVRSIIRTASSSACSFDSRLIERFASVAARSSSATASTEPMRGSRGPGGSSKPPTSAGAWPCSECSAVGAGYGSTMAGVLLRVQGARASARRGATSAAP